MEIVRIENHKKGRKLVYLDEDTPAFSLYSKEIAQFGLEEGKELTGEIREEIIKLLSKRARERALFLLDDMARTEQQIRVKLREGMYPDEAVEYAVAYCKEKHYIDDADYAARYISSKSDRLSRRMIEKKLLEKGISRDILAEAFEKIPVPEEDAIRAIIRKKHGNIAEYSFEERQKVIKRLLAAGFPYDAVKKTVDAAAEGTL
ncbi:MAG: regulatory protein RecX [Lachnospiraceae bacterium]|nr:regulatory protein RecX [Lachnospiraceae bacterium]